jgi:DHA2 family multidrug resistance protein
MASAAGAAGYPDELPLEWQPPKYNPYLISLVVTLATFMEVLDTTIANVALPHIAGNLSAGTDESTWVLTSYLVSNAIILPLNGFFSRMFGRKRFYMICVAMFTLSSVLCGLAPSLGWLVFFRVLQGLGGGGMQPSEQAILVDTFPPHKRAMGMAVYGIAVVVAPIVGPTLGGWITDNFSWRWVFFINIPVGILSLLLTSQVVQDPPHMKGTGVRKAFAARGSAGIDFVGLGLLAAGLGALQIMLDKGQREDWFESNFIIMLFLIAVFCLVGSVVRSLRQRNPVVDFRMLKERNFALSNLTMFVLGFVLYGSTMLLPLFLQQLMGYTAMQSGMTMSPGGVVVMVLMPIVGLLLGKFQARWLVVFGLAMGALSLFDMARFNLQIDFWTAMMSRVILGIGLAFLFVPINTAAFYFVPADKTSNATGLINLARNIGGSCGIAFATTLLERRAQYHQSVLVEHVTPYNDTYREMIQSATGMLMQQGQNIVTATKQAQALVYGMVQREAAMLSFLDNFWIMGVIFLAAIPLMFLMKKTRPHKGPMGH